MNYEIIARLQFTGLRTKIGAEIYDGDVLQSEYKKEYSGTVLYSGGEFRIKRDDLNCGSVLLSYDFDRFNWTIIGNIHHTPKITNN